MQDRLHISYYNLFFFIIFFCTSICLLGGYTYESITHIPIQPLSERGLAYFKKTEWEIQTAHYGCNARSNEQLVYTTAISDDVTIGLQHGACTVTTRCGQNTMTVGIDVLGIINVIPVLFEALCRSLDINKKYYRQDKKEYYETILYEVDKKRCDIYVYHRNYDAHHAQQQDIQYLTATLDELEISIRTCNKKICARHAAKREARERIQESLRCIQSQYQPVAEQYHATNTNFSKKEDTQELKKHIQGTFTNNISALENMMQDSVVYAEHIPLMQSHAQQRINALQEITTGTVTHSAQTYEIQNASKLLLENANIPSDIFAHCYGNQYQQCLHQESLSILEHTGNVTKNTAAYQHRHTITNFVEVACEYNHAGACHKAVPIFDFCWTLLSWGSQIIYGAAEGAVYGVMNAAIDTVTHPIETGVSMVVGSSVMLTYQLSKIVYVVADLSITTLIDYSAGKEKWNSYIEPINQLLDAIKKQEVGLKETSKAVTQFGMQWYTQAKLLGCLRILYDGIKTSAIAYMSKDDLPQLQSYLTTPDGVLMQTVTDALDSTLSHTTLQWNQVTTDGTISYTSTFAVSNTIRDFLKYSTHQLSAIGDGKILEHSITGLCTFFNAHLKGASSGSETIAAIVARLQKEAAALGSSSPPGPKKDDDEYETTKKGLEERNKKIAQREKWTNKVAHEKAKNLDMGFEERKDTPPPIKNIGFYNGKNWITPDIDGHKGGAWKMFDKSGKQRLGTFSEDLKTKVGN